MPTHAVIFVTWWPFLPPHVIWNIDQWMTFSLLPLMKFMWGNCPPYFLFQCLSNRFLGNLGDVIPKVVFYLVEPLFWKWSSMGRPRNDMILSASLPPPPNDWTANTNRQLSMYDSSIFMLWSIVVLTYFILNRVLWYWHWQVTFDAIPIVCSVSEIWTHIVWFHWTLHVGCS